MDRREFLVGLFGLGAATALPAIALSQPGSLALPTTLEWQEAIARVYSEWATDLLLYGNAALVHTSEFPYIRNVPMEELYIPPTTGGLLG